MGLNLWQRVTYQHVTDPCQRVITEPDSSVISERFILGGATLGRFLFTHDPVLLITAPRVLVMGCSFEVL